MIFRVMMVSRRFEHSNLSVRVAEVHQIRDFSVLDLIFHQNPPWTLNGFSDLIKEKHDYMEKKGQKIRKKISLKN